MPKVNEETQVPCPICGHPTSLLTKKKSDGNWHLCNNGRCLASFWKPKKSEDENNG